MNDGAVVTGASYRALAVVRSLGRRGVPVRVVRSDEHAVAAASRYAGAPLAWPLEGPESARVDYLLEIAERDGLDGWVLIPTHDEEAALIARHHARLAERYRLTTPPWEILRAAYDKRRTHVLGAQLSLTQPWTAFPAGPDDLARAHGHFPVVVKPAYKQAANRLTMDKAWRADDAEALRRRYDEACRLVDPAILMLQELIPGDGAAQLSFAALCRDGEVLASLTACRTRQFPMDFGRASSYVETIDDAGVERDARCLLEAMRFTGLVEVEFKRDRAERREPPARRQPAPVGLAVAVRARRGRLPVPAVADGGGRGAWRPPAGCQACTGCACPPTCSRSRGSCAPAG